MWVLRDDEWLLQVGRIGCIVIDHEKQPHDRNIIGWRVMWHEQSDYVQSEGIRLKPDNHVFSYTDEGLQQAKQAGVVFAYELLQEAIAGLGSE